MNSTPTVAAPFEAIAFFGLEPGPRLLVLGAVHGNEVCGPTAIHRVVAALRDGGIAIRRGRVTFVPVANGKAFRQGTRAGDRNLNRELREYAIPQCYEDRIGNVLCPLLRDHDALLDIHSFTAPGPPFTFVGPPDNEDEIEPFSRAAEEMDFAAVLGPDTIWDGWLTTWVAAERERARLGVPASLSKGVGTNEYIRRAGGYGVTIECGTHDDPQAVEVAHRAILNALAHLRLIDAPPPPRTAARALEIVEAILCLSDGDRLEKPWTEGEPVAAGTVIARRADGTPLTAPRDGFVVFPSRNPKPFGELYFFGVPSRRLG